METENLLFDLALSLYILCLYVCVYLYLVNVKTVKLIGPNFVVGPHMTPGFKVYERSKFQKFASNIIGSSLNFENPRNFFL